MAVTRIIRNQEGANQRRATSHTTPSARRQPFSLRLSELGKLESSRRKSSSPNELANPWSTIRKKSSLNEKYDQSLSRTTLPLVGKNGSRSTTMWRGGREEGEEDGRARTSEKKRKLMDLIGIDSDEEGGDADGRWYGSIPHGASKRPVGISEERARWLDDIFAETDPSTTPPPAGYVAVDHRTQTPDTFATGLTRYGQPVGPHSPPGTQLIHIFQNTVQNSHNLLAAPTGTTTPFYPSLPNGADHYPPHFAPDATSTPHIPHAHIPYPRPLSPIPTIDNHVPPIRGILKHNHIRPFYPQLEVQDSTYPPAQDGTAAHDARVRFWNSSQNRFLSPDWTSPKSAATSSTQNSLGDINPFISLSNEPKHPSYHPNPSNALLALGHPRPASRLPIRRDIPSPLAAAYQGILDIQQRTPSPQNFAFSQVPRSPPGGSDDDKTVDDEGQSMSIEDNRYGLSRTDQSRFDLHQPTVQYYANLNRLPPPKQNAVRIDAQSPTPPLSGADDGSPSPPPQKAIRVTEGAWASYTVPAHLQAPKQETRKPVKQKKIPTITSRKRDETPGPGIDLEPSQIPSERPESIADWSDVSQDEGDAVEGGNDKQKRSLSPVVEEDEGGDIGHGGDASNVDSAMTVESAFGGGFFADSGELGFKVWRDGY